MSSDEQEPTQEELADATSLAQATERGSATAQVPEDALGAAALLRYSADGGTLGVERKKAILDELLERAPATPMSTAKPKRRSWIGWLGLGPATAAVAAAVLLMLRSGGTAELPRPPATLLSAQARAARSDPAGARVLSEEMAVYRRELYAVLEERYGSDR